MKDVCVGLLILMQATVLGLDITQWQWWFVVVTTSVLVAFVPAFEKD